MKRIIGILALLAACSSGGGSGGGGAAPGSALPLQAASVEFGAVEPGHATQRTLTVRNPDDGLPVRVTRIEAQDGSIGLVLPALPAVVQPGGRLLVEVIWTPEAEGFFSSLLRVESDERDALDVALSGLGFLAESRVDFPFATLDAVGGRTAELSLEVPADAISFTIEAWGGTRASPTGGPIHLASLVGPGGHVYVDEVNPFVGPYWFDRNFPASPTYVPIDYATFLLPNTDAADAQLIAGGGTYRFVLSNAGGSLSGLFVRATIERRRTASEASAGHIDLNVFIPAGHSATAATAPTHPHLQSLLARTDAVLGTVGLDLGEITYYKLTDPFFDFGNPFDPSLLFRQSAMAAEPRLNVFLVLTSSNGVAGLTGALPCPRVNGSATAGIFVIGHEGFHPDDEGTVLAHEIGHALGLGHTREAPGLAWQYDRIEDTCPGPACYGDPLSYLMDTSALPVGFPVITPGQAHVIRGHMLVEPGSRIFTPGATLSTSPLMARVELRCATCGGR